MKKTKMKISRKKAAAICILAILILLSAVAAFSLSRFYTKASHANDAKTAGFVVKYSHKALSRTGINGSYEAISFSENDESVIINDVEPSDTVDYYFSLADINSTGVNEVAMNVMISVSVRLEMMASGGEITTSYFSGWHEYGDSDGTASGASLKIYASNSGTDRDIRPPFSPMSDVDYSGNSLYIGKNENTGEIFNIIGLRMKPYDGDVTENIYHLKFLLPKQEADAAGYVGARVYFEITVHAEQAEK